MAFLRARRWLVLAQLGVLGATIAGCFDSHGSAPPGGDGGTACMRMGGSFLDLRCEIRGGEAHAIVTTAPFGCCGEGSNARVSASSIGTSTGTLHELSVDWTVCDCCAECRCVGPSEEVDVSLGPIDGIPRHVQAGDLSCTLSPPPVTSCDPVFAEDARWPQRLFDDQSFAATVHLSGTGGGCGCSPELVLASPSSIDLSSGQLCDCCDACDCIDGAYEVSIDLGPLPIGEHEVVIPHGVSSTTIVDRSTAHPIEPPTSLVIVSPSDFAVVTGPRIDWVLVRGTETVCCVSPAPVIDVARDPVAGTIDLVAYSANQADCECLGSPVAYEAAVPLVGLGSGGHLVRAGSATGWIVVP